jgi:hypothetical protein
VQAVVTVMEGTAAAGVSALAFSRDGKFLALAAAVPDLTLSIRMPRTGEVIISCPLEAEATAVSFNPFNAYEVLAAHAAGGTTAGATLHVMVRRCRLTPRLTPD